jgi:mannitol/fructose-specific phosphotransferase system IIA component (Ntr-type)
MALSLADLVHAKYVDLDLRTRTRETALRKLVRLLAEDRQLTDPDAFLEHVLARERSNPSAVVNGVVFPHARTELVEKIVLAVGRSRGGIPFQEDGQRARLIFLIGVPQRLINDYLVAVGGLARLLKDDELRQKLRFAETPHEFSELLKKGNESPFD